MATKPMKLRLMIELDFINDQGPDIVGLQEQHRLRLLGLERFVTYMINKSSPKYPINFAVKVVRR